MVLLGVEVRTAHFMVAGKPAPVVLFEMVRALVTGQPAELGEVETVTAGGVRARE